VAGGIPVSPRAIVIRSLCQDDRPPKKGTAEADRFDVLAMLIEACERVRWPMPEADPVDVIRYRMETHGYTQAGLARVLGSRACASEIMRGKRPLSKSDKACSSTSASGPIPDIGRRGAVRRRCANSRNKFNFKMRAARV
jgi:antitoxin component HigA of HigAB toxin-antitoxin module